MYYVEHFYITPGYFIDGGVRPRRFKEYRSGDGLEKIYPQLRDEEVKEKPKKKRKKIDRSGPQEVRLAEDRSLAFERPTPIDFTIPSLPGAVDYSPIHRLAEMFQRPAPVPPSRGELMKMSIDGFERMSEQTLAALMSQELPQGSDDFGAEYLAQLMSEDFGDWDKALNG